MLPATAALPPSSPRRHRRRNADLRCRAANNSAATKLTTPLLPRFRCLRNATTVAAANVTFIFILVVVSAADTATLPPRFHQHQPPAARHRHAAAAAVVLLPPPLPSCLLSLLLPSPRGYHANHRQMSPPRYCHCRCRCHCPTTTLPAITALPPLSPRHHRRRCSRHRLAAGKLLLCVNTQEKSDSEVNVEIKRIKEEVDFVGKL